MPRILTAAALGLGLAVLAGCGGDKTSQQVGAMNTSNVQRLANLYAAFQNIKGGKGPKDEAEFKAFIAAYDMEKLRMMGVDTGAIDKTFTSERDGQPIKMRYGVGGGRGALAAVSFEATGKDGKKQVGFTGGPVEEVDDARYQDLWTGKAGPPAGGGGGPAGAPTTPGGPPVGASGGRPSGAPPGAPKGPM